MVALPFPFATTFPAETPATAVLLLPQETIPAPPFTVSFLLCPFTSTIFVLLIDSGLIFGLVFFFFVVFFVVVVEYDRVCEKHADLWDKVDEAYFDLPDDYDFDNYDEAAFIRSLSFLTDAEKDALIADYNRLVELDNQLCKLYDTIWGNTGCEGGICPL